MPNYAGNPKIAEYGENTRFGAGNCPRTAQRCASRPWSIRNAIRDVAVFEIEINRVHGDGPTVEELLWRFKEAGQAITASHLIAAQTWNKALSGDLWAMERVIKAVDGGR